MLGFRRTHDDPPLPEHGDDWSADRLLTFHRRLSVAASGAPTPGQVDALLDEVPATPRNVAALLEHLVDEHARRARETGRSRAVVAAPLPAGAVARVGHLLVVRWLTRRQAMGRRVIRRVSHSPAAVAAPSQRTGWLLVRHLTDGLTTPAPA